MGTGQTLLGTVTPVPKQSPCTHGIYEWKNQKPNHMSQSAWAAITRYYRLDDLNKIYFSQF